MRGISSPLYKNEYTKNGWAFAGWYENIDDDGKGAGISYANSQNVINIAEAGQTKTLYAHWAKLDGFTQSDLANVSLIELYRHSCVSIMSHKKYYNS